MPHPLYANGLIEPAIDFATPDGQRGARYAATWLIPVLLCSASDGLLLGTAIWMNGGGGLGILESVIPFLVLLMGRIAINVLCVWMTRETSRGFGLLLPGKSLFLFSIMNWADTPIVAVNLSFAFLLLRGHAVISQMNVSLWGPTTTQLIAASGTRTNLHPEWFAFVHPILIAKVLLVVYLLRRAGILGNLGIFALLAIVMTAVFVAYWLMASVGSIFLS